MASTHESGNRRASAYLRATSRASSGWIMNPNVLNAHLTNQEPMLKSFADTASGRWAPSPPQSPRRAGRLYFGQGRRVTEPSPHNIQAPEAQLRRRLLPGARLVCGAAEQAGRERARQLVLGPAGPAHGVRAAANVGAALAALRHELVIAVRAALWPLAAADGAALRVFTQ